MRISKKFFKLKHFLKKTVFLLIFVMTFTQIPLMAFASAEANADDIFEPDTEILEETDEPETNAADVLESIQEILEETDEPKPIFDASILTMKRNSITESFVWDPSQSGVLPSSYTLRYAGEGDGLLRSLPRSSLPAAYNNNLRNILYQTTMRMQGNNGVCWSFSAYAGLESQMLKAGVLEETFNSAELDLAELHLVHATSIYTGDGTGNKEQGFVRAVNDGGNRDMVTAYLMRGGDLSGAVNDEDDTYELYAYPTGWVDENGNRGPEIQPRPLLETKSKPKSYTVQNIRFLGGGEKLANNDIIKEAVMEYGAVSCNIYYGSSEETFDDPEGWDGWVEDPHRNTHYYYREGDAKKSINHGVAIVGWDDNYDKNNFGYSFDDLLDYLLFVQGFENYYTRDALEALLIDLENLDPAYNVFVEYIKSLEYSPEDGTVGQKPENDGAWLVKNSWGTIYNEQEGYFWLSYEDTAGPITPFVFDGVAQYNPELRVYEHDPLGFNTPLKLKLLDEDHEFDNYNEFYGANVFTVLSDHEVLESVKVFVPQPNSSIDVYINKKYQDYHSLDITCTDTNMVIEDSFITEPGYYTFDLPVPAVLGEEGSEFAVIVKFTDPAGDAALPFEVRVEDGFYGYADANEGESFCSDTGDEGNWWDLKSLFPEWYANINIKAVTSPKVDKVVVSPSTVSVGRGASQAFSATVYKGEKNLAQAVMWSVSGSSNGSVINSEGILRVAANETAPTLTVTAASTLAPSVTGTALVTITGRGSGSSDNDSSGGSGSSGNNSSGGGAALAAPSAATVETVDIIINGQTMQATINDEGVLEITYTEADLLHFADGSGSYDINVAGQEDMRLNIPISSAETGALFIETDFGVISIPSETLQALKERYGDILRLAITKGSFKIALLNSKGTEIAYNDPDNPFAITLPYTLKSAELSEAVVAVKENGKDNKILPLAVFKNGNASFDIASTGTYDLIYNEKSWRDTEGHWAADNILFAAAREIFTGTGNGDFTPDGSMTRAMFATVLARLDGADLSDYGATRFDDVPIGQWYSSSVGWAADKGIVSGVGDDCFAPDDVITREQMAVMLDNYFKFKKYSMSSISQRKEFSDKTDISPWAEKAVESIQMAGIISGKENNLFDPKGIATRAEAATIFTRFISLK